MRTPRKKKICITRKIIKTQRIYRNIENPVYGGIGNNKNFHVQYSILDRIISYLRIRQSFRVIQVSLYVYCMPYNEIYSNLFTNISLILYKNNRKFKYPPYCPIKKKKKNVTGGKMYFSYNIPYL